jgi:hypothetical protein
MSPLPYKVTRWVVVDEIIPIDLILEL